MPKLSWLRSGAVVWIPCELGSGVFPAEQRVRVDFSEGTLFGYVPREDIREEGDNRGFVRSVVLKPLGGEEVAVLFRGELLSESNPVVVPRGWLESVGRPEV